MAIAVVSFNREVHMIPRQNTGARLLVGLSLAWASVAGCDAGSAGADAGATIAPLRICDGTQGVRLAVAIRGGGPSSAGQAMLSENGWQLLLVTGSCRASLLTYHVGPVREVSLSQEQEEALSRALRLGGWASSMRPAGGGCVDAPGISYRFDGQRLSGAVCGLPAGHPLEELNAAFLSQLQTLAVVATPVSGDVRYLVQRTPSPAPGDSRAPVAWPLAIPLGSVVQGVAEAQPYTPGTSRRATASEANMLRAISATATAGPSEVGPTFDFTPIVGDDGQRYQLFIRDALPFENDNGLLPAAIF
jgi:hypothetical protein